MKPIVSLVMPTYNRAKYVPMAIRCFYQQTYPNLELIVVDDGAEALTIPADDRIQYIHLDTRVPTGMKRNLGAERTKGEIIANLDDDDWSHPHRIEDEVQRLQTSGKAVTGYCQTVIYDEFSKRLLLNMGGPPYPVSGTSQVYWKDWWRSHPYPNATRGEDSVFSRNARLADQLAACPVGEMMVATRHSNNTDQWAFPVGDLIPYKLLQPDDISHLFFEAIDNLSPTLQYIQTAHVCTEECQRKAETQFQVSFVEYKTDARQYPEISTR